MMINCGTVEGLWTGSFLKVFSHMQSAMVAAYVHYRVGANL